MKISAFYANYFYVRGIAYAALSVIEAMQSKNIKVSLMGIASDKSVTHSFYHDAVPRWLKSILYRFLSNDKLTWYAESRFIQSLALSDIAYIWPPVTSALIQKLRKRGNTIILEFVNTHQATSKAILDAEFKRLNIIPNHGITAEKCQSDTEKSELVDFIFSCSPAVTSSLLKANIPKEKILETTYGLSQCDLFTAHELKNRSKNNEINAIYVGSIDVRKGPHLLLEYWCESGVKGKLTLVGDIRPEMEPILEPYLKRHDIKHLPYVMDLKPIYQDADLFLLPSLEEGSPLVTYMALGAGLPCIVSPMGAGGVVEHGVEGLVIEPHDSDNWIDAIKKMAEDVNLREKYAKNAHNKASDYLWPKVGQQRAKLLLARLPSKGQM